MFPYHVMNLRLFDESESEDVIDSEDDFDFDAFQKELEAMDTEEAEKTETPTEETPPEPTEEVKPPVQTPEANRAFQALRQQVEESKKHTDFVKGLAEASNMSVDEYLQAVTDARLEKEAKDNGVDPVLHKKNTELAKQNQELEKTIKDREFSSQIEAAKIALKLNNDQVMETFTLAYKQGLDPRTIPFNTLYNIVHIDDKITQAKAEAKQEYLEELKKKQENFVPHHQGNANGNQADVGDSVLAYLKEMGDI